VTNYGHFLFIYLFAFNSEGFRVPTYVSLCVFLLGVVLVLGVLFCVVNFGFVVWVGLVWIDLF